MIQMSILGTLHLHLQSSASRMIVKHYLFVLFSVQLCSCGVITRIALRVDIDDLSIAFILKQQTLRTVCYNLI